MLSLLLNKCQSRVISIFIDVVIFGEFEGGFFLDIQQQNSSFDSEFVDVLKCNHFPCVNTEPHMYFSLHMDIGQQIDVNFAPRYR